MGSFAHVDRYGNLSQYGCGMPYCRETWAEVRIGIVRTAMRHDRRTGTNLKLRRAALTCVVLFLTASTGCRNDPTTIRYGPANVTAPPSSLLWITPVVFVCAILSTAVLASLVIYCAGKRSDGPVRPGWLKLLRIAILCARGATVLAVFGVVWSFRSGEEGDTALYLGAALGTFAAPWCAGRVRRRVIPAIRDANPGAPITALVQVLSERDLRIREEGVVTLARILPALSADDLSTLSTRDRRTLYRQLAKDDVPLVIAVLGAAERMSDRTARPYVERLIRRLGQDQSNRLRETAERCLHHLRQLESQGYDSLLRPVSGFGNSSHTLVRPASGSQSDASILLRPGGVETRALRDEVVMKQDRIEG